MTCLAQGVIEPATGPWSSPVVLVQKNDRSTRFCVDFRQLNFLTKKDAHPLPQVDDTLDSLSVAQNGMLPLTLQADAGRCRYQKKIKRKQHSLPRLVCFSSAQCLLGYAMHPVPSNA